MIVLLCTANARISKNSGEMQVYGKTLRYTEYTPASKTLAIKKYAKLKARAFTSASKLANKLSPSCAMYMYVPCAACRRIC